MNEQEICFWVGANNAVESNLFLRKFYELMSHEMTVAWNYQSFREGKRIKLGYATFGEVWIDYKERGKINNVFIYNSDEHERKLIISNLKEAKNTYKNSFLNYTVTLIIENQNLRLAHQARNNISISYDGENKKNIMSFGIKAFGKFDCQYVVTQKLHYTKHLLCVYTNLLFDIKNLTIAEGIYQCCETENSIIDNDWIETSELFISEEELLLSNSFFDILELVLKNEQYERSLRLVLNSSQQLYCANLMKRDTFKSGEYNIPGYIDLINTTLISALEPISNIDANAPEVCTECGQLKYSIRKKVNDLCGKYLPEHLVRMISNELYSERSAFLHEGNAKTNEFYCGRCMPLLDPVDGRSMMQPVSSYNSNMFDYVSYVIRKVIEHWTSNLVR